MFLYFAWPIVVGRKPIRTCYKCDHGLLTETGAKDTRRYWLRLPRKEYVCEHCGHNEWLSRLSLCLGAELDSHVCSQCEKTTLRRTEVSRSQFFKSVEWEFERIHCGNKEWHEIPGGDCSGGIRFRRIHSD